MTYQSLARRSIHAVATVAAAAAMLGGIGCTDNGEKNKGEANITKGQVEDAVGNVTGDSHEQARGATDKAKGHLQKTVGSAEQAVGVH